MRKRAQFAIYDYALTGVIAMPVGLEPSPRDLWRTDLWNNPHLWNSQNIDWQLWLAHPPAIWSK